MMGLRFPSITRVCTERKLKRIFPKLKQGKVLYIGVHTNLYKKIIPHTKFTTLDIDKKLKPDIVSDIHDIKIKSNQFDTVIALQVLEHCYDSKKAMDEIYRVLNKNGTAIISVPFMFHYHPCPKDYYRFTEDSLKDISKKFKKIKIVPVGNKFLVIWQLLSRSIFKPLFHLLNPLIAYLDFNEKSKFALNYILIAEK